MSHVLRLIASATLASVVPSLAGCWASSGPQSLVPQSAHAQAPRAAGLGPIVQPKVPGEILGFDIDQHGNDGFFANYQAHQSGDTYSVETFNQRTGKITKVVIQGKRSYAAYAIITQDVGVLNGNGAYKLMNPVKGGKINGSWTPPMKFILTQIAENQQTSTQLMLGYDASKPSQPTTLIATDVLRGTSKVISLDQGQFGTGDVPVIAQDPTRNQGVIAGGNGAPNTHPTIGIVDLKSGKMTTFTGLGYGFPNGLAVDSRRGVACTTTEIDAGVEFYDLKTRSGFEVTLPNSGGSQIHSGSGVAMDSKNGLCLIAQPVSGNGTQASAIWVADEKGNFPEEITGFNFWFGVGPAINPTRRTGYILNPRPTYLTLTGFSY
jgi:hypothetical protein